MVPDTMPTGRWGQRLAAGVCERFRSGDVAQLWFLGAQYDWDAWIVYLLKVSRIVLKRHGRNRTRSVDRTQRVSRVQRVNQTHCVDRTRGVYSTRSIARAVRSDLVNGGSRIALPDNGGRLRAGCLRLLPLPHGRGSDWWHRMRTGHKSRTDHSERTLGGSRIALLMAFAIAGLMSCCVTGAAWGAPNLVRNGELDQPAAQAEGRWSHTGNEAIFEFPGDKRFGRVVVRGQNGGRQLSSEVIVSYSAVAGAAGRTRGLLISGKDVKFKGTYDITVYFDLDGKIRPKKKYAYSVLSLPQKGANLKSLQMIAPAIWADGKLLGANVNLTWDDDDENTADSLVKRGVITMPNFKYQTGGQSLVLKLPQNFKGEFFLERISLREIDEALLAGEKSLMPTPTRYVEIEDPLERRIAEALEGAAKRLEATQHQDGYWPGSDRITSTASALSALGHSGHDLDTKPMRKAKDWLADQEVENVEQASSRLRFFASLGGGQYRRVTARDVQWLTKAQFDDGG